MNLIRYLTVLGVSCLLAGGGIYAADAAKEAMTARIQQADEDAILEAGRSGDTNFIPALEAKAQERQTDRRTIAAKMALAKLGVRKYLDEILLEARNPANSPAYKGREKSNGGFPSQFDKLWVQMEAFKKLEYIKDRSTVKTLASFLYDKENREDYLVGGDVVFDSPSDTAMRILAQMVDNPPQTNLPVVNETHDARVKIWQQWWEKNKDKYP